MLLSAISVLKNKKYTIDDATLWKSKAMLDSRMKDLQGQSAFKNVTNLMIPKKSMIAKVPKNSKFITWSDDIDTMAIDDLIDL